MSFRPSIEQYVMLIGSILAALQSHGGPAASSDAAMSAIELSTYLLQAFEELVVNHPNPKKVFAAVLGKAFKPLLLVAFTPNRMPSRSSSNCSSSQWQYRTAVTAAQQLLSAVLFYRVHLQVRHLAL